MKNFIINKLTKFAEEINRGCLTNVLLLGQPKDKTTDWGLTMGSTITLKFKITEDSSKNYEPPRFGFKPKQQNNGVIMYEPDDQYTPTKQVKDLIDLLSNNEKTYYSARLQNAEDDAEFNNVVGELKKRLNLEDGQEKILETVINNIMDETYIDLGPDNNKKINEIYETIQKILVETNPEIKDGSDKNINTYLGKISYQSVLELLKANFFEKKNGKDQPREDNPISQEEYKEIKKNVSRLLNEISKIKQDKLNEVIDSFNTKNATTNTIIEQLKQQQSDLAEEDSLQKFLSEDNIKKYSIEFQELVKSTIDQIKDTLREKNINIIENTTADSNNTEKVTVDSNNYKIKDIIEYAIERTVNNDKNIEKIKENIINNKTIDDNLAKMIIQKLIKLNSNNKTANIINNRIITSVKKKSQPDVPASSGNEVLDQTNAMLQELKNLEAPKSRRKKDDEDDKDAIAMSSEEIGERFESEKKLFNKVRYLIIAELQKQNKELQKLTESPEANEEQIANIKNIIKGLKENLSEIEQRADIKPYNRVISRNQEKIKEIISLIKDLVISQREFEENSDEYKELQNKIQALKTQISELNKKAHTNYKIRDFIPSYENRPIGYDNANQNGTTGGYDTDGDIRTETNTYRGYNNIPANYDYEKSSYALLPEEKRNEADKKAAEERKKEDAKTKAEAEVKAKYELDKNSTYFAEKMPLSLRPTQKIVDTGKGLKLTQTSLRPQVKPLGVTDNTVNYEETFSSNESNINKSIVPAGLSDTDIGKIFGEGGISKIDNMINTLAKDVIIKNLSGLLNNDQIKHYSLSFYTLNDDYFSFDLCIDANIDEETTINKYKDKIEKACKNFKAKQTRTITNIKSLKSNAKAKAEYNNLLNDIKDENLKSWENTVRTIVDKLENSIETQLTAINTQGNNVTEQLETNADKSENITNKREDPPNSFITYKTDYDTNRMYLDGQAGAYGKTPRVLAVKVNIELADIEITFDNYSNNAITFVLFSQTYKKLIEPETENVVENEKSVENENE